jgi:hypothetical protein
VLTGWAKWAETAPDNVTTSFRIMQMPPLEFIPEPIRGRQLVIIDGAVTGDDPEAVIAPLRALAPEMDTFATVPAGALSRLHGDPEEPTPFVSDTALVEELPLAAIQTIVRHGGPGSGSPLLMLELRQCGGAIGRVAPGHGALPRIDAKYVLFMGGIAVSPDVAAAVVSHAARVKEALAPWLGGGHYLNFAEVAVDPSTSFGAFTWRRLRVVKRRVDPDNVIRANHEIPPVE